MKPFIRKALVVEENIVPIESSNPDVQELQKNLINTKKDITKDTQEIKENKPSEVKEPTTKKYTFKKGDQTFELDEDAELEMTADKKSVRMSLRELKDRAAGDIAVKNRMHSLAEEKKKVQSTLKGFTDLASKDPLAALEYISNKATEADSEFEYKKYLNSLAVQAEKLGKMDEKDLKTYELEKKLTKVELDLSLKEREAAVVLRKQELLSEFPEIGDQQFGEMVETILDSPELSEGINDENDLMNVVDSLIRETLTQRDIITVISEIDPAYAGDNDLIFSISDQIKKNPELEEDDIREIIKEILMPMEKEKASQVLSHKTRGSSSFSQQKYNDMSDFEVMKIKLQELQEAQKKR